MEEFILQLKDIHKNFGNTKVLKGISLDIAHGEFITLLGASGCGKTTTIRIIAGLEEPSRGQVLLNGTDVTHLEPNKREVNTVFQNYALFPHMNVWENVAYSQKLRGVSKAETNKRVLEVLELVQLEGYEKRKPSQLSGGQGQRVAIARAVINRPKVLLLDEPLGALDLQLRHQMQAELKELQKRLGITFVYITHDQDEALNMSDRIVVMKDGQFEQIGTPIEIYNQPATSYVANFVGSSNVISGSVTEINNSYLTFENKNGSGLATLPKGKISKGQAITVAIKGENVSVEPAEAAGCSTLPALVKEKNFAGGSIHLTLELADKTRIVSYHHGINCPVNVGDKVCAHWNPAHAVIVDLEG